MLAPLPLNVAANYSPQITAPSLVNGLSSFLAVIRVVISPGVGMTLPMPELPRSLNGSHLGSSNDLSSSPPHAIVSRSLVIP